MSNGSLIVGLGNPGLRYKKTRHNIGFRVLDEFQKGNDFPKFKLNKKFRSEVSEGEIAGKKIVLAKPQTYMNKSGLSVKELSSLLSKELSSFQFIVVHDDFDLQFGEVKISQASGAAGHHGVESIIQALGTNNFKRVRVGTHPNYQLPPKESKLPTGQATTNYQLKLKAEDFVLKKFSKEEEKHLPQIIKNACSLLKENYAQN